MTSGQLDKKGGVCVCVLFGRAARHKATVTCTQLEVRSVAFKAAYYLVRCTTFACHSCPPHKPHYACTPAVYD